MLDSGASRSMGSALAIHQLLQERERVNGDCSEITFTDKEQHTFRFGNGMSDRTSTKATVPFIIEELNVEAGEIPQIEIHVLETEKYVPLLGSITFLQKSGAVIDFENHCIKFGRMSNNWYQLEVSTGGHLLLDLVNPPRLYTGAHVYSNTVENPPNDVHTTPDTVENPPIVCGNNTRDTVEKPLTKTKDS